MCTKSIPDTSSRGDVVVVVQAETRYGVRHDTGIGESDVVGSKEELLLRMGIGHQPRAPPREFRPSVEPLEPRQPERTVGTAASGRPIISNCRLATICASGTGGDVDKGARPEAPCLLAAEKREHDRPPRPTPDRQDARQFQHRRHPGRVVVGAVVDRVGAGAARTEMVEMGAEQDDLIGLAPNRCREYCRRHSRCDLAG